MRDRQFENHLNRYYDAVIAVIRDGDSILIFGPGEAKGELRKRLESGGFKGHILDAETEDKMTDCQIAAKVREHLRKKQRDLLGRNIAWIIFPPISGASR